MKMIKKTVSIIMVAALISAYADNQAGSEAGLSVSVSITSSSSGEKHQFTSSGKEVAWNYTRGGTQIDLSDKASYIWQGIVALGVVDMDDQKDLPGYSAEAVSGGVTYLFEVTTNGVTRSYSYLNPASGSTEQEAKVASIMAMLEGIAAQVTLTEESWQEKQKREKVERDAAWDSYLGRKTDKLETRERGIIDDVEIIRRKGDHYIVKHSRGTLRIPCDEVIEKFTAAP